MRYDVFFSISQTPVDGHTPSEAQMFRNFFAQVEAADAAGYGTAWVAESHLSSEVQKSHREPVIPHWKGEVGLNCDITQLAHHVFARTKRIEVGSAVMNIVCNGGPVAAAERIAYFATLHGQRDDKRKLNVGFSAGRFDFMNRAYGIGPRNELERVAWPAVKGMVFAEATEIFCRLLRGDTLSSDDIPEHTLSRTHFRNDADWDKAVAAAKGDLKIARRWTFEPLKIIPQDFDRSLIQLVIGSHDAASQTLANTILPTHVFNLSITAPAVIEDTHKRLAQTFHRDGGPWQRHYMPRTTFVFLDEHDARAKAAAALGAYWTALEGTLDPKKVSGAADNALIGNADTVAKQIVERFHRDDRLMLWFDFFNHDSKQVIASQNAFAEQVIPRVAKLLG
jgi:alkanesulfonate monooxygenase SsuD/methylene tetrahydromethanopterin reductase-like flavin-dependent oxidoreductase (luciferase family)